MICTIASAFPSILPLSAENITTPDEQPLNIATAPAPAEEFTFFLIFTPETPISAATQIYLHICLLSYLSMADGLGPILDIFLIAETSISCLSYFWYLLINHLNITCCGRCIFYSNRIYTCFYRNRDSVRCAS